MLETTSGITFSDRAWSRSGSTCARASASRPPTASPCSRPPTSSHWAAWRISSRAQKNGDRVHFVINVHINPTNVCVLNCKFCDYVHSRNDDGAWEMTPEEIVAHITPEMHEVHIVGGHHPDWPFEYHEGYIRAIREAHPRHPDQGLHRGGDRLLRQALEAFRATRSSTGSSRRD